MTFLPIAARELRVKSRRQGTWLIFFMFAIAGALGRSGEAIFVFYIVIRVAADFIIAITSRNTVTERLGQMVVSTRRFAY